MREAIKLSHVLAAAAVASSSVFVGARLSPKPAAFVQCGARRHGIHPSCHARHRVLEPRLPRPRGVSSVQVGNSSPPGSAVMYATPTDASSIISSSNNWGNIAALSFTASLAQLLGRTTLVGKLLGAPVTAMALTFVLSSVGWIPTLSSSGLTWNTLLPPGGSQASSFLQGVSLTLATPLLLLGTSIRGKALQQCGALLGSFAIASVATLAGAVLALSCNIQQALVASLPNQDGIKIAAALLAKNIGGGINYMAVCSCLSASPESIAAGLCVDNVMALIYFPLVSMLASKYDDVEDGDAGGTDSQAVESNGSECKDASPIEALSHAFTLAAVLTSLGQYLNSNLHHLQALLGRNSASSATPLNLSLPITTLLAVLFSTFYPPNMFLSPTSSINQNDVRTNSIARAGETLGTSLLYLFFATAGAPGWRLKDSIQQSFPSIASFLIVLYGVHGAILWFARKLVKACTNKGRESGENDGCYWQNVVAPQRLLTASSAAIGGPATAAALAKSFNWNSLLTPSLLVGNIGYAVATFIALLFYGYFR